MTLRPDHSSNPGRLILVVGPSGVGKDSLLDGARAHFADDPNVTFPRRVITRPEDSGGEAHQSISKPAFRNHVESGDFALHWEAHGLSYGVPVTIVEDLRLGRTVVVNVSRTILGHARARFRPLTTVSVTTQRNILAQRLRARGREDEGAIQRRLARAEADKPAGPDVIEIDNSGALDAAIAQFTRVISDA